jgi:hypothetical protein
MKENGRPEAFVFCVFSLCYTVFIYQRILIKIMGSISGHHQMKLKVNSCIFSVLMTIGAVGAMKTVSCCSSNCAVIITDVRRGLSGAGG